MNKTTTLKQRAEDFKKVIVFHTLQRIRHCFRNLSRYKHESWLSKANVCKLPHGALKKLGRTPDGRSHIREFCEVAGLTYHQKISKKTFKTEPWVEVPFEVLERAWSKRKAFHSDSDYYTSRQSKLIAKVLDMAKDHVRGYLKDNADEDLSWKKTNNKEDKTMTKAREEQIRQECAEGKHCLDADTLIKQEKKQERAAAKQRMSIAKRAAKETLADYTKLQLELEMAKAEIKRLKALVNENADIPGEADLKEKLRAELREELMQELTREWEQEMEDFERQQAAEASATQMPRNPTEPVAAEKPKEISHPEDDLPSAQEIEQMQVADQAAVPQQPPPQLPKDDIPVEEVEPKVYQHFSPERLQHFVDKLYISHVEANKIASTLKMKFNAKPNRQGFSSHDAWNHRLERKKIFTTLQAEAQPLLDDKMNKWLDVKLK